MAKSIPWAEIKSKWVTTDTSFKQLGDEYGIHHTSVMRRAEKENWHSDRTSFQRRAQAQVEATATDDRVAVNRKHYELWGKVIEKLETALLTALELDEIDTLTKALERAHKGQRLAREMDRKDEQQQQQLIPDALAALANGGATQPAPWIQPPPGTDEDPREP